MHTEDEAKTKWCPYSRVVQWVEDGEGGISGIIGAASGNRASAMADECACIASECMAWRWTRTHINDPDNPKGDLVPSSRTYGYCGLAGEPK